MSHVEVTNATRVYETTSDRVTALAGVTFSARRGERIALLGRSGSGKSTLLNLLGGLDRVTSGSLRVAGQDLATMTSDELAAYRLRTVGMVFQAFNLIRTKTALQNVEVPQTLSRASWAARRQSCLAALGAVGLKDRAGHRPAELSGGEQQRVAIARALANQPELLLADEPTGNLDSSTAANIIALLMDHSQQHQTTVVLVTHDEELATTFADRTLRLSDGRLIETD